MSFIGRPRSLDDVKRREICALISAGCGLPDAARYVGCSVSTIRREALRNDHFRKELRGAEVRAQLTPLQAMRQAASSHWRAAAWLLERTNPRRFARPKPDACGLRELHDVVEAVVDRAVEEIPDLELRDRVCRQLLATAYGATRTLAAEERRRLDPRSGFFEMPLSSDAKRHQKLMDEIDNCMRERATKIVKNTQKAA